MKRESINYIVKLILLFLAVSYGLDKIIYFGISKIDDRVFSGQTTGKLNQYMKIKDRMDFIVYGSSRANHNIDPDVISKNGFNMGVDGQKIAFSSTLLQALSKKAQILLFHVEPDYAFDASYNAGDLKSLRIEYTKNNTIKKEIDRYDMDNPIQNFYWCMAYTGKLLGIVKNYFKPNYDYKSYSGYDPIVVSKRQTKVLKDKIARRKMDTCKWKSYVMNPIYDSYLGELKSFCKENNKTLIFYTSPELYDICKEDNVHFTKEMKSRGLLYYDFTDYFSEQISYEDWKDFTHLSNIGAEKFTEAIKKIILESSKTTDSLP